MRAISLIVGLLGLAGLYNINYLNSYVRVTIIKTTAEVMVRRNTMTDVYSQSEDTTSVKGCRVIVK